MTGLKKKPNQYCKTKVFNKIGVGNAKKYILVPAALFDKETKLGNLYKSLCPVCRGGIFSFFRKAQCNFAQDVF